MKLKNILLVVSSLERSKQFYRDLFGLHVVLDNDGTTILTEGLVLQEAKLWSHILGQEVVAKNHACELYFEEPEIEAFVEKLEQQYPEVSYANRLMTFEWGQTMVRFYDPDGHLIEVRTPG